MSSVYTKYNSLPIDEDGLKRAGWTKQSTSCDPKLGYAWTQESTGATKSKPLKIYTTEGGQLSGIGIIIQGGLPGPQKKWTTKSPLVGPSDLDHIDVALRTGRIICDGAFSSDFIGNALIVNPNGQAADRKTLPMVEGDAMEEGWQRGSCFDTMGTHWFLDTQSNGAMTWKADNVFPVVIMFHEGKLNSIFFASKVPQRDGGWEPSALPNRLMCFNMCDKNCKFTDNNGGPWSTSHVYFNDHSQVKCDISWTKCKVPWPSKMACCDGASVSAIDTSASDIGFAWGAGAVGLVVGAAITLLVSFAFRSRAPALAAPVSSGIDLKENLQTTS